MSPASVHVLTVGRFGTAVADRLKDLLTDVAVTPVTATHSHPMTWPTARLHVVASWRETDALFDLVDRSAAAWRTPWLPVVLETSRLRIGPLVDPGHGACHRCFEHRRTQHDGRPEIAGIVREHYAANPGSGPDGFLPSQVTLAVSGVLGAMSRLQDERRDPVATVRTIDVLDGGVAENDVVPVHGCTRCGRERDLRRASVDRLARDLTTILPAQEPTR
ncbi:TOMM precursor leader peptide-binding protein [Patulibacter minatonensis]|uniref:TOMM precursor leader peptide-binding protein n=1 Tax=Patulibacter minatonensis TaxID=298163 RepID=UPI00047B52A2|nr:TOMM precursor leader peptide-binding protein [Patulibacter minatonensis]